jgi:nucleolar protein 9
VLYGSYYGKYFAKRLKLHLLQRRPDEWRELQSQGKIADVSNSVKHVDSHTKPEDKGGKKRKRSRQPDEIDVLFRDALGKKPKKGALVLDVGDGQLERKNDFQLDKELQDVLGSIKAV